MNLQIKQVIYKINQFKNKLIKIIFWKINVHVKFISKIILTKILLILTNRNQIKISKKIIKKEN